MYRLSNGLSRALLVLAGILAVGALMSSPANADEPTPRAMPAARALPRTFASYDAVIEYATAVAADQSQLDAKLAKLRDTRAAVNADSVSAADVRTKGGYGRVLTLAYAEHVLVASGALTADGGPWTMPTGGQITQPFGPTKLRVEPARVYQGASYAHFHEGVDIAGDWMADVVAPARARVAYVGRMFDGAEIVVLAHDDGLVSLYAHLDAFRSPPPVQAGDQVAAGQKIGTVGMTGFSLGMHLHWAAWRNGELIDPMSLLGH